MAGPRSAGAKSRLFTVEEANKALPLVKAIVADIVEQFAAVNALKERMPGLKEPRRRASDQQYAEETEQSVAEIEAEEAKLATLIDELTGLGVELKGPDGLCDFPSLREGREVYLCWRLGEPEVSFWHEKQGGFAGRQPVDQVAGTPSGLA